MTAISEFPHRTCVRLRYGDTDRQGHINNAVFVTLLEVGRVELLYDPTQGMPPDGREFVLASLKIDFRAELRWPGDAEIGTAVVGIGRSSLRLDQHIYQDGRHVATAETVSVLVDRSSGRPAPFAELARSHLSRFARLPAAAA